MLSNTHRWLQLPLSRSWYAVPSPRRPPIRLDWELLIPGVLAAIACSFRACTPNPTLGLRESRFRDPGDGSFDVLLIQDRASLWITSVLRPDTGQRDVPTRQLTAGCSPGTHRPQ